jgi:hypothetical protein
LCGAQPHFAAPQQFSGLKTTLRLPRFGTAAQEDEEEGIDEYKGRMMRFIALCVCGVCASVTLVPLRQHMAFGATKNQKLFHKFLKPLARKRGC